MLKRKAWCLQYWQNCSVNKGRDNRLELAARPFLAELLQLALSVF